MTNEQKLLKKYDVALATRNFEIELFWKRSIFFWGFIASSFVGYAASPRNAATLSIIIACFGFVCSLAWSLVNRGSKYWHENWESIVAEIENDVTGPLFKYRATQQKKGFWLGSRKFSVSRVTIALSDFSTIIWFSIISNYLLKSTDFLESISTKDLALFFVIFTFFFSVCLIIYSRSKDA